MNIEQYASGRMEGSVLQYFKMRAKNIKGRVKISKGERKILKGERKYQKEREKYQEESAICQKPKAGMFASKMVFLVNQISDFMKSRHCKQTNPKKVDHFSLKISYNNYNWDRSLEFAGSVNSMLPNQIQAW